MYIKAANSLTSWEETALDIKCWKIPYFIFWGKESIKKILTRPRQIAKGVLAAMRSVVKKL